MRFRLLRGRDLFGRHREELPEVQSPPPTASVIIGLLLGAIVLGIVVGVIVADLVH